MSVSTDYDHVPSLLSLERTGIPAADCNGISSRPTSLHDGLDFLRRQAPLILWTAAAVTTLALAVILAIAPIYAATNLVLVDPNRKSLLDTALRATDPSADGVRIGSDVEIMRSDNLLLEVIGKTLLADDAEFGFRHRIIDRVTSVLTRRSLVAPGKDQIAAEMLYQFRKAVSVRRLGSSNLIAITVRSQDPAKAARLANAIAHAHIELQVLAKAQGARSERNMIEVRIGESRRAVVEARTSLSSFIADAMERAGGSLPPAWANEPDFSESGGLLAAASPGPDMLAEFHALQQSVADATRQFQVLLSRRQTLDAEESLQVPDSRVVSPAIAPARPGFPHLPLVAALSALMGCGIGLGAAFIREHYIGGFTTTEQIAAVTRRPVSAALPKETNRRGLPSLADMLISAPFSGFCESVRRLRATIDTALEDRLRPQSAQGSVVMVTSALANEGKTTIALSLARAYASSGRSVILLDCDLRAPALHSHLGVKASTGLVDVLTGKITDSDLSRILVKDPRSQATSIIGGRMAELPADQLFASRSFARIIESARASFDYVVIDAPPVEPTVDTLYLARHADAVVFIVRWATTPQRAVMHALEQLTMSGRSPTEVIVTLNGQGGGSAARRKGYTGAG